MAGGAGLWDAQQLHRHQHDGGLAWGHNRGLQSSDQRVHVARQRRVRTELAERLD